MKRSSADLVAGILAAAAFFAGLVELFYRPFRIAPVALVVALVAIVLSGQNRRLVAAAVGSIGICFVIGASLAVSLHHPLY